MAGKRRMDDLSRSANCVSNGIAALERERAALLEEVLQLKAAVHVWTAVCRRIESSAATDEREMPLTAG